MEIAEHIEALRREGEMLSVAAARAAMDAAVPACPEWCVRDLVRHTGGVHRWAAWNVSHPSPDPVGDEVEARLMGSWPADDGGLLDWFREGHAALVETLATAAPDVVCWSFLPAPSPLAFWARRQAHETAIHRADAESATGPITPVAPSFGADGLDELLRFATRRRSLPVDGERSLALHATDGGGDWLVRLGPGGIAATRESGSADCSVRGTASDLYLLLWNRRERDGLQVDGDPAPLELWRETVRIRWT